VILASLFPSSFSVPCPSNCYFRNSGFVGRDSILIYACLGYNLHLLLPHLCLFPRSVCFSCFSAFLLDLLLLLFLSSATSFFPLISSRRVSSSSKTNKTSGLPGGLRQCSDQHYDRLRDRSLGNGCPPKVPHVLRPERITYRNTVIGLT
jgi:hypothetical protein